MDAPEAFPPTPKSITLLLQYLNQEPHPKEVNIAILDVPETNYDNDDDDPDSRHHRSVNDNASNSTTTSTVDNYPMRSYAKVQTNLGIHAPDLPILAREFRAEYYFLRRLYRDGFCSSSSSSSTASNNNNNNNDNIMNMTQRSKKLLSTRFFDVTSCLLLVCPDHSTAWADRRRALLVKGDMIFFNEDVFQRELEFLDLLFTQHSKA